MAQLSSVIGSILRDIVWHNTKQIFIRCRLATLTEKTERRKIFNCLMLW